MKRLGCVALILAALLSQAHGQQPQTPPVEVPPVIAPPVIVKPDADEPVVPTPDPLTKPFAIVATSRGAVLGDLIARPEVGHLLELTVEGLPADAGPIFFTYSEVILDRSERDAGKWVGLSFPPESSGKAYLVQAAVNGPAGSPPLVAMRWLVVSGNGPRPPPTPTPPAPIPDDKPPTPATLTHGYFILIDSWQGRAATDELLSLGPESPQWAAMKASGHKVQNFDTESTEAQSHYPGYVSQAPVLLAFDADKGNAFVTSKKVGSIADVSAFVKELTGKEIK